MVELRKSLTSSPGLVVMAVLVIASEAVRAYPGEWLWDFGSFVASARAARQGLNPYGVYELTFRVVLPGFDSWNPNLNPPISALLFQAFDIVEPRLAFRVWVGVSILLYAATVFLLIRRYWDREPLTLALCAFALAGFWDTLVLGQIYIPLVLASAFAWLHLERERGVSAGILIGLVVAMKPNFLVWPALLFLSGHRTPALVSVATAGLVSAIPVLVYGPEVYRQWFELIASDHQRALFLTNVSLTGLAARMGVPGLGVAASIGLLLGLAVWAIRRRPDAQQASAVGLVAALLASPIAWIHYTLFLLPVLFSGWNRPGIRVVGLLLMVPVPFVLDHLGRPAWIQSTVGSLYGWAMILCLVLLLVPGARFAEIAGRVLARRGRAGA